MNPPKKTDEKKKEEKPAEKAASVKSEKPKTAKAAPRGKIYENILETIGGTPLVRMPNFSREHGLQADLLAKLEFFNPTGSVKDRVALAMIEEAEAAGKITPGKTTLIEATSGNTGFSLACVAAAKGYPLVLTMPENVPYERRKILSYYGAELFMTPSDRGMTGAIEKAKQVLSEKGSEGFMLNQFDNVASVQIHAQSTAKEIWDDTKGKVDIIVAGVGTGATITGVAHVLRKLNESLKVYGVEPEESPVLSGGTPTQHQISGIGVGFVPSILDQKAMDGVLKVHSDTAMKFAREAVRLDGVPCGISSGAALAAASDLAKKTENKGKTIVVIFSSFAERYISTPLFANTDL
jgi:cysteine synthase A